MGTPERQESVPALPARPPHRITSQCGRPPDIPRAAGNRPPTHSKLPLPYNVQPIGLPHHITSETPAHHITSVIRLPHHITSEIGLRHTRAAGIHPHTHSKLPSPYNVPVRAPTPYSQSGRHLSPDSQQAAPAIQRPTHWPPSPYNV